MTYKNRLIVFFGLWFLIIIPIPLTTMMARAVFGSGSIIPDDLTRLWSIDTVEGLYALQQWRCCDRSTNPKEVIIGRDGYLFLGNGVDKVLDKTIGDYEPSQEDIDAWTEGMANVSRLVQDMGAAFVFSLAPNKHTVYEEFLPTDVVPAQTSIADRVAESVRRRDVPFLDLRQVLIPNKPDMQVYLKTDTHWSNGGATLAYTATMDFLNTYRNLDLTILPVELVETRRKAGDLSTLLKVSEFLGPDHDLDYLKEYPDPEGAFCLGQGPMEQFASLPCAPAELANGLEWGRPLMAGTQLTAAPNDKSLLLVCDSFCFANADLFNASFSRVFRVHWKDLEGPKLIEQISNMKPDIVIYQMVERNLLNTDLTF